MRARALTVQHHTDLRSYERGAAVVEALLEAFVIVLVLGMSAVLTSAVLRSAAEPGAESCEVAGH